MLPRPSRKSSVSRRSASRSARRLKLRCRGSFRRQHGGKADREHGPAARPLVDVDSGAVRLRDARDDSQAETGIPAVATVAAPEALKYVLAIGFWYTRPAIHDSDYAFVRYSDLNSRCWGSVG